MTTFSRSLAMLDSAVRTLHHQKSSHSSEIDSLRPRTSALFAKRWYPVSKASDQVRNTASRWLSLKVCGLIHGSLWNVDDPRFVFNFTATGFVLELHSMRLMLQSALQNQQICHSQQPPLVQDQSPGTEKTNK